MPCNKIIIKHFLNYITVEPIILCYVMPSVISYIATQNLNLYKACRVNLNLSDYICDNMTNVAKNNSELMDIYEQKVQVVVSGMYAWTPYVRNFVPLFLILFLGSFSDRNGMRKPFLLLPIFGELISSLGLILCTYFVRWPMEVAGIIENIFPALTGSQITFTMAAFSYIGDITTLEERTLRIGVITTIITLAIPVGSALSGYLYYLIGFYGVFITVSFMYMLGLIYGIIWVPESGKKKPLPENWIKDIFDPHHLMDTLQTAFKNRSMTYARLRIILIIILHINMFGPSVGESTLWYLFSRAKFQWDEIDFSLFSSYTLILSFLGNSISMWLFVKHMKLDDSILGLIGIIASVIAHFGFALAKTKVVIYLVAIIDMISGCSFIAQRSIGSKLVPNNELGKINSLFGICDAILPMIYSPIYSFVYKYTVKIEPGIFLFISAILFIPNGMILILHYFLQKKSLKIANNNGNTEKEKDGVKNEAFQLNEIDENLADNCEKKKEKLEN